MADEVPLVTCYGPGSIAGAIIGTLLITLALVGGAALLYKIYWRSRKGKHLVLVTDVESPDQYAFDNPNFREATPIKQSPLDEKSGKLENSWLGGWSPLHVFSTPRNDKQRSLDDSYITDSQLKVVSLKSHDFTGLGFSVCGNMRDGIFVKDLLHRGPAFESGCMNPGDRIDSVCISFRHMVFEDALTILSYASPYEVQIQVEHNTTSRPSTLLRKRDNNASTSSERILHPFYRSQSISDLPLMGKMSGRRSNQPTSTIERNKANKNHDSYLSVGEYPTLKLSPSNQDVRKEYQNTEKRAIDTVDAIETSKHTKFGIRVLPVTFQSKAKDHSENEQNIAIEHELPNDKLKVDNDTKDVKTILTKGLQNLKDKINSNSLGRRKKEDDLDIINSESACKTIIPVEQSPCSELPEEVARAATAAQSNRKSVSAESLAARKSLAELNINTSTTAGTLDSDTSSEENQQRNKKIKSKGKAPAPPKASGEATEVAVAIDTIVISEGCDNIFEPMHADSDSETEGMELTCTQATVHHSSTPDEPDSGRKAASLGDLSRFSDSPSAPLERAMSLDLDGSHCKKRKAPPPPQDDFCNTFDDAGYRKEPRLEGYNTFQRTLKKSSDFGTLEDALQNSDNEDLSFRKKAKSPEPESTLDINSVAATNIQEFSTWLQEVRKPHADSPADHHLTLNVNGTTDTLSAAARGMGERNTINVWDISSSSDDANTSDVLYSSAMSNDEMFNSVSSIDEPIEITSSTSVNLYNDSESIATTDIKNSLNNHLFLTDLNQRNLILENDQLTINEDKIGRNLQNASIDTKAIQPEFESQYLFSVNGKKVHEPIKTVLLISQPNSIENIETVTEDDTPPQLPLSPPPNTSLTYITEIRVVTPEPSSPNSNSSSTPRNIKPQRKDVNCESSKIPIRTMKSETGQKVLAAIQSLAAKEINRPISVSDEFKKNQDVQNKDETTPSVAGFYLKKVPPAVPPRRSDSNNTWSDGPTKERVNGTPMHFQMSTGVSLPVKTSATKIVFESQEHNEEF